MTLVKDATFPIYFQFDSGLEIKAAAKSFKRRITNKPIVVPLPMTSPDGSTQPQTLYKDLKMIKDQIILTIHVYSATVDGTEYNPTALAILLIDKLKAEPAPVTIKYRGYSYTCVLDSAEYVDDAKVHQAWTKYDSSSSKYVTGGTNSPDFVAMSLTFTYGSKRV